jgi:adenine-specific DNA-methyltransferase
MTRAPRGPKDVVALRHDEATRTNIPTAELQSFADQLEAHAPSAPKRYPRARPLAERARRERTRTWIRKSSGTARAFA